MKTLTFEYDPKYDHHIIDALKPKTRIIKIITIKPNDDETDYEFYNRINAVISDCQKDGFIDIYISATVIEDNYVTKIHATKENEGYKICMMPDIIDVPTIAENTTYEIHAMPGIVLNAPETVIPSRCVTSRHTESDIRNHHNRILNTLFNVIKKKKYIGSLNFQACIF